MTKKDKSVMIIAGSDNMLKKIKKILLLILSFVLLIISYLISKGYVMYDHALVQYPITQMVEDICDNENYTTLEELPQMYINAVIAVEDQRYYRHSGIDIYAISRALYHDLLAMSYVEGGSTITQQLAKNVYFTQEKKIERKIAEVFMAQAIEKVCSKDQILELYLNSIYFGDGYYCVYDASMGYFDKEPIQMDDYESTLLAGIPNAPSVYSLSNSPTLASQRQKQVLKRMIKNHYITKEQADAILQSHE